MTPHFQQHAQPTEFEPAWGVIPALFGFTLLTGMFVPGALAGSTDCQTVDQSRGGVIEGITSWKDAWSPLAITVQRDLLPTPFLESALLSRNTQLHRSMSGSTCWSQSLRKNPVVNQALLRSIGKGSFKSFTQVMTVPVLHYNGYNGKTQVPHARSMLPEIAVTPRERISSIIGPVQEKVKIDQSHIAALNQTMASQPFPGELRPIVATDAIGSRFQLPVNESLRMNMTTTQALHGGNCASGCP